MPITLHTKTITTAGPKVRFDCPACGAHDVTGEISESVETTHLFFVIPFMKLRNTWIACSQCKAKMYMSLPIEQLVAQPPASINSFIRYHASTTAKLLAILGLFVFWVPGLGVIVTAFTLFLARGTQGWPKKLAWLGLIGGIAVTATILILKLSGIKV